MLSVPCCDLNRSLFACPALCSSNGYAGMHAVLSLSCFTHVIYYLPSILPNHSTVCLLLTGHVWAGKTVREPHPVHAAAGETHRLLGVGKGSKGGGGSQQVGTESVVL